MKKLSVFVIIILVIVGLYLSMIPTNVLAEPTNDLSVSPSNNDGLEINFSQQTTTSTVKWACKTVSGTGLSNAHSDIAKLWYVNSTGTVFSTSQQKSCPQRAVGSYTFHTVVKTGTLYTCASVHIDPLNVYAETDETNNYFQTNEITKYIGIDATDDLHCGIENAANEEALSFENSVTGVPEDWTVDFNTEIEIGDSTEFAALQVTITTPEEVSEWPTLEFTHECNEYEDFTQYTTVIVLQEI